MAGSPQDYINKIWEESQKNAGLLRDQRTQTDDATIQQINEAIDRATNASVNPYKTQMEQLPAQYQKLFDTNAVQELVGRKQIQEAMANMGLTDSGLNRTQQTALSLQRGNADYNTRLAQQQKTQELQDKISQLMEAGAAQKQQQETTIRGNTANWYNDLLSSYYGNAVQQGTDLYNNDQERTAALAEAKIQQQIAAAEIAAAKARQAAEATSAKTQEKINSYLQRAASGAGNGTLIRDTANTTQFRAAMMTPGEFSRRSTTKSKYGNYDNYIKSFLSDWYNQNKLSNEEFAFLLNYYGL
jgi:hypothetical protein